MNLYVFTTTTIADHTQEHVFLINGSFSDACKDFRLFLHNLEAIKREVYLNEAMAHAANLVNWKGKEDQEITLSVSLSRTSHFKSTTLGSVSKSFQNKADLSGYLASLQLNKNEFPKDAKHINGLLDKANCLMARAKKASIPLFFALGFWGFCAMDGATIYAAPVMAVVTLVFILSLVAQCVGARMENKAMRDRDYAIRHGLTCQFQDVSKREDDIPSPRHHFEIGDAQHLGQDGATEKEARSEQGGSVSQRNPSDYPSAAAFIHQFMKSLKKKSDEHWTKLSERLKAQQHNLRIRQPSP